MFWSKVRCPKCGKKVPVAPFCAECKAILMPKAVPDQQTWRRDSGQIARRVTIRDARRALHRGVVIEFGSRGLLLENGQLVEELDAGVHQVGFFERIAHRFSGAQVSVVIVSTADQGVDFTCDRISTSDNLPVDVRLKVELRVGQPAQFLANFMRSREMVTEADLEAFLRDQVRNTLEEAVRGETLQSLQGNAALRQRLQYDIEDRLRQSLAYNGFELVQLVAIDFSSAVVDATRRQAEEAAIDSLERQGMRNRMLREVFEAETAQERLAKLRELERRRLLDEQEVWEVTAALIERKQDWDILREFSKEHARLRNALELALTQAKGEAQVAKAKFEAALAQEATRFDEEQRRLIQAAVTEYEVQVQKLKIAEMWREHLERRKRFKLQLLEEKRRLDREHAAGLAQIEIQKQDAAAQRAQQLTGVSTQAILATTPDAATREDIIKLHQTETMGGMTGEQMLGMAAQGSAAAAEALGSALQAKATGEADLAAAQREAEIRREQAARDQDVQNTMKEMFGTALNAQKDATVGVAHGAGQPGVVIPGMTGPPGAGVVICPQCRTQNDSSHRHCKQCGKAL